jgi:hypothetical protein
MLFCELDLTLLAMHKTIQRPPGTPRVFITPNTPRGAPKNPGWGVSDWDSGLADLPPAEARVAITAALRARLQPWLLALACLTGCAGGGGGSGNAPAPPPANPYPPLNSVTQPTALSVVSSNDTFNLPTTAYASTGGTVAISVAGNGSAITTVNVSVTGAGPAGTVSFQQTFNSSTFQPQLDSAGATVSYYSTVTASDNSVRQLLLANTSYALFNLNYMTLGFWEYDTSAAATSGVGGAYAAGIETRANDLPTTGTASYTGGMIGRYADGTSAWAVAASAASTANFAAHSVSLTTSNSFRAPMGGGTAIADNSLNLTGVLFYPAGINQLSGTLTTGGGMTGAASAKFFGPGAKELGGTFFVTNGGTQQMVGAFGLHQ